MTVQLTLTILALPKQTGASLVHSMTLETLSNQGTRMLRFTRPTWAGFINTSSCTYLASPIHFAFPSAFAYPPDNWPSNSPCRNIIDVFDVLSVLAMPMSASPVKAICSMSLPRRTSAAAVNEFHQLGLVKIRHDWSFCSNKILQPPFLSPSKRGSACPDKFPPPAVDLLFLWPFLVAVCHVF